MGAARKSQPFMRTEISPFICVHFKLIAERDRLNKDLEMAHSAIKQLEAELDNLQVGYSRGSSRR